MLLKIDSSGFKNRIENDVDMKVIKRVITAYNKAKLAQKEAGDAYQVGDIWTKIYDVHIKEITSALTNKDEVEVARIYSNFFRESCSWGLHGLPLDMQVFFSDNIPQEYVDFFAKSELHCIEIWLNSIGKTIPVSDLESPVIGNPYGFYLDGKFIKSGSHSHHFYATMISRLTRSKTHKTVLELGGGFGGLAHYLIRDNEDLTYIDIDLPENMALSAFNLLSSLPDKKVALYGEIDLESANLSEYDAVILPNFAIEQIKNNSIDLSFNSYSLAEMPLNTVTNYINHFNRMTTKFIYHINHTKFSTVKADDFEIDLNKFELISRAPAHWNMATNKEMDEFEFLYKAKQLNFT